MSQVPGAGMLSRLLGRDPLPRTTAPPTPLNRPVSMHRRYAFVELPLADIKKIKSANGVTVNDVVMALAAGVVRRWLLAHDALPDRPLVVGVPFSIREHVGVRPGNQVTLMTVPLPTQVEDPRLRLGAVHESMRRIKERFALAPAGWLSELSESLPAAFNGLADRAAFALAGQAMTPINLIVSNIPGPQMPLSIAGVRMLGHYPVSMVTGVSGGLNITAFSYDGRLDIGFTACRDLVPDVWTLPEHARAALTELLP
ncbi:WS/DGAT domain-containing protein [Nonomuraea sp. NBC_01738]|uniref:WS/DGAT domain-containing protein n=1 Tax=Nonomuraea sp. NBC_01738 TaxID=2976003 RepID=UPI002E155107|nr:WS/DGAT domain-containing protein [Nonomuraea sp. NBC_01738]